jgi:hypothetical protein
MVGSITLLNERTLFSPSFPEPSKLGLVSAAGPLLHLLATVNSFRCAADTRLRPR